MQLSKHLAQGKLLYLSQGEHAISVCEDDYYRWLAFSHEQGEAIIQSVMNKRIPWQLTLPHQYALLLPLLFFKPKNIIEFGLGGGNLKRFISHLSAEISMQSVEYNNIVIECFKRYFNPENDPIAINNCTSEQWLTNAVTTNTDWLICDIYQSNAQQPAQVNQQLADLIECLDAHSCLSINLPNASDDEVNLCLLLLQQLQSSHSVYYFHIPNYLNIVIQLIPAHWSTVKLIYKPQPSYLAKHTFIRWRSMWQSGHRLSNNQKTKWIT